MDAADSYNSYAENYGLLGFEELKHLDSALGNTGTGAEDGSHAGFVEEVVVLGGDHTTGSNEDILTAELLELFDNLGNEGLMTGCE